jgi:Uma2 family endonuclease
MDIEAFEAFIRLPENSEKRFELLRGEPLEMPSNILASHIAATILFYLQLFLKQNGIAGMVTGADGGYIIGGQVFAPDVAYTTQPITRQGFAPHPPLLAVEVLSEPQNSREQSILRRKLVVYARANVVVWVVDYDAEQVEVHTPHQDVLLLGVNDSLTGGDVLPHFTLAIRDIFPPAP